MHIRAQVPHPGCRSSPSPHPPAPRLSLCPRAGHIWRQALCLSPQYQEECLVHDLNELINLKQEILAKRPLLLKPGCLESLGELWEMPVPGCHFLGFWFNWSGVWPDHQNVVKLPGDSNEETKERITFLCQKLHKLRNAPNNPMPQGDCSVLGYNVQVFIFLLWPIPYSFGIKAKWPFFRFFSYWLLNQ